MAEPAKQWLNYQNQYGWNKDQLDQGYNGPLQSVAPLAFLVPPDQHYYQFQQSTGVQQAYSHPLPYSGLTPQSPVQYQDWTHRVSTQRVKPVSHTYKDYNGKLSVMFGVINILLVTITIILNGFTSVRQPGRGSYDSIGNFMFFVYPSTYCGLFIYITAALAIASGKKKTRCLITAHLVLSIMGIASSFAFVGVSIYTLLLEINARDDNVSFATAILWIPLSVTMFITVMWGSGLCCKVVCCRSSRVNIPPTM